MRTTPEAIDLQASFRAMLDAGDRACAIEVSSHALALHRTDGVHFAAAIFTNLTQDHLDFHGTMDDYFAAKARLFELGPALSVIGIDDDYGRRLAEAHPAALTFALDDARRDYGASELRFGIASSRFIARTPAGELELRTRLPGRFNVANVLGALAAVHGMGVPLDTIAQALPGGRPGTRPLPGARRRTSRSACSSTTRTRPTRSRTCCAPRARSASVA